jgi:hypothetical protein
MITIRPRTMPRFWWLCPWAYARVLHTSANAVKAYADRLDDVLDIQRSIIEDQSKEISTLKARIADLNDAVIRGKAIIPDAEPHE